MAETKNIYCLPLYKKDLIKGVSHPEVHKEHFKYALDFILPEGSKLIAVADGKVVSIKVDSNEGGFDLKYNDIKYVNYITLEHANGEFSQYVHLKHNGSLVKVGDEVKEGQEIGLSGNTGFTTAPHLHFQIFKLNKTEIGWETLKIRFKETVDVDYSARELPKEVSETLKEAHETRD